MLDLSACQPTDRFSGLAEIYARSRPGYPEEALDFIVGLGKLGPQSLLVDVGCGTGISARQLAARGIRVIGIEPNRDMREQAKAEQAPPGSPRPEFRSGTAEATGLAEGSVDMVLAAQAFHWFEPVSTLKEFHRILKRDGWTVLMWNERDSSDPFTAAYGEVFRMTPEGMEVERSRGQAGGPLLVSSLFQNAEKWHFHHEQEVDEDGLLGRAFSASYAPRDPAQAAIFAARLRAVFAQFQREGTVKIRYETSVYVAQKAEPSHENPDES